MEWMFLVTANRRARVDSRILQVLDHHMVPVQSYASSRMGNEIRISFIAEADSAGALRTGDLLRKLQDVQSVDWFASQDGLCRTLALFKVMCDQESRLPLLQVISSLDAQVVAVRPDCVAFEVVGAVNDIRGLRESLLPYGLVETVSMATAMVRKEATTEAEDAIEASDEPLPKKKTTPTGALTAS